MTNFPRTGETTDEKLAWTRNEKDGGNPLMIDPRFPFSITFRRAFNTGTIESFANQATPELRFA
jgi:hypothetical protein